METPTAHAFREKSAAPLLELVDLRVNFRTPRGILKAVDQVNLTITSGQAFGLVGESGCGKSVTAASILRLIPEPPGEYAGGEIRFDGCDLLSVTEKKMQGIRGRRISMIFQEPMSCLNPIMTAGSQVAEAASSHQNLTRSQARNAAIEMLRRVGIPSPEIRARDYPHQLSGGMKQRVMIAMALICGPRLLIADEPTTSLDVTIQMQILELLNQVKNELGMSVLLITHDLGVVAQVCDHVAVMYAGRIVESAPVELLFDRPRHPYTRALLSSVPSLSNSNRVLEAIPGSVPNPLSYPKGCRFRPRCPMARLQCDEEPPFRQVGPGRFSACHYAEEL
ncbi:MAG TPA: ABC transporter ATP-binding protein [Blastocatellia bacterium]|nr:ABC transporter ATP-binding protein [Blastocatellia bacterium]